MSSGSAVAALQQAIPWSTAAQRRSSGFLEELLIDALLSTSKRKCKVELNSLESRNVEYISEAGPVHIQKL